MLLRKAFVTSQQLSWTDKLLCPHTQSQDNEISHSTPDLLLYRMLPTDLFQSEEEQLE